MRRIAWRALAAILLCIFWIESALAFTYYPAVPQGAVGWAAPRIAQRLNLEPGDRIVAVEMWLDGRQVTARWDQSGLVYYDPPEPLAPGDHRVRMVIHVVPDRRGYVYAPVTSEFVFTVRAGALPVLPAPRSEEQAAREAVNRYRAAAGVVPPVALDSRLIAAAALQAEYLVRNPAQADADAHRQLPDSPGFVAETPGGRARYFAYDGGVAEVINFTRRAEDAVAGWMDTLYHRIPLLHPGMTQMGYAVAGGGALSANVALLGPYTAADRVVRWPAPGATDVPPLWEGLETPDPLALYPGVRGPVGYPITLTFGRRPAALRLLDARLTGPEGTVRVLLYDPERDPELEDTVAVIPVRPLRPGAQYVVTLSGQVNHGSGPEPFQYTWSFQTAPEARPMLTRRVITYHPADGTVDAIRLEGHAFPEGVRVFLGGLPVQGLVRESESVLRFRLPLGYQGGPADLLVVTPGGLEAEWPGFLTGAEVIRQPQAQPFRAVPLVVRGRPVAEPALVHSAGAVLVPESVLRAWGLEPERLTSVGRTWWRGADPASEEGGAQPAAAGTLAGEYSLGSVAASAAGAPLQLALPVQQRLGQTYLDVAFVAALTGAELRQVGGEFYLARPVGGQIDVDGHWAAEPIARLLDAGVVSGYGDGTFRPDAQLTRAAFVRMLVSALGLELRPGDGGGFTDTSGHWVAAAGYLGAAAAAGIVRPQEYPQGRFEPDRPILREEIAVLLVRALGREADALATPVPMTDGAAQIAGRWFADAAQWQRPRHVAEAVRAGWIAGYPEPDGRYSFRPDRTATRAEAAALLVRAVGEALGRAE
ncbi:MAG: hypothetical protein A6D92_00825 [Symbiobacterium thermophilum]|uniref:SLH domain-containing protein n=1 Tax=Symbiobacterium thermophilum TaxID=2734 RepID=A0A1Y2T8W3_SYMTR|nr:MAG: hypothetical protein A6D92_00825 [Symbiobacterium thermophilum]